MIYNSYDNVGLVKVLSLLKSHNSEYLSGQDLSDVLKISRVAVWKHIKKIQELGYKIESKQKRGYKLTATTKLMLPWEITSGIKTQKIGKRAYYFDVIDSTQNFASQIASNTKEDGTVIISQKQTNGRGRMNRNWISPSGGIWLSVILHPKFDILVTTLFPIGASLALAIAIEKTMKIKPELKWPNDITINGKKIAGMLIDLDVESNKIKNLVLGVGINFQVDSKKIEKVIKKSGNFYGVDTLTNNDLVLPTTLIQSFLYELEKIYELLNKGKTTSIIQNWTKRSSTIGKIVYAETTSGKIKGKAIKINKEGALIISQKEKQFQVIAGDVKHIR